MRQALPLRIIREEIAEAIDEGATLGEVEDRVIDERPLSPEARDALWLFAWASLEAPGRAAGMGPATRLR